MRSYEETLRRHLAEALATNAALKARILVWARGKDDENIESEIRDLLGMERAEGEGAE